MFKKRMICVYGTDVDVDTSELEIGNIDEALRRSASQMGYWASVAGAAEKEYLEADSFYRNWKGKERTALSANEPKLSDAKMTARIEGSDQWARLKTAIAEAKGNLETAKGIYGSWLRRVNLAQSIGAMQREELEATGKGTTREQGWGLEGDSNAPAPPKPRPAQNAGDEASAQLAMQRARMREILKKEVKTGGDKTGSKKKAAKNG